MSSIFSHKSGYLISVKLLIIESAKCKAKSSNKKLFFEDLERLENSYWLDPQLENLVETTSPDKLEQFTIESKDYRDYLEIEPKFNRVEIAVNSLLLALFTIVAAILAAIFSPGHIFTFIKSYNRNFKI